MMQGFGWAIAKALAEAGAEISLGVWVSSLYTALALTRAYYTFFSRVLQHYALFPGTCSVHIREQLEKRQV